MSLVVGVPFAEGILVAGERGATWGPTEHTFSVRKVHEIGGRIISVTGSAAIGTRERVAWSLESAFAELAPAQLEIGDVEDLGRRASEAWRRAHDRLAPETKLDAGGQPPGAARAVVWLPEATAEFLIGPGDVSPVEVTPMPASRGACFRMQGAMHLVDASSLSMDSRAFIATEQSIRDVAIAVARALALDVLRSAVGAAYRDGSPFALGGAIDVSVAWRDRTITTEGPFEAPSYTPPSPAPTRAAWSAPAWQRAGLR